MVQVIACVSTTSSNQEFWYRYDVVWQDLETVPEPAAQCPFPAVANIQTGRIR
jgi:hypothetical protein